MGNSLRGVSLLSNVHYFPYHVQLGRYAAIDVTKTEAEEEEEGGRVDVMKWNVSYTVDESTCKLELERRSGGKDRKVNEVCLRLHDDICAGGGIHLDIGKAETNLLKVIGYCNCGTFLDMVWMKTNMATPASGGVTVTTLFVYGSGSQGGLIVWESQRKSRDEDPHTITLTHYYATSRGNFFGQARIDIGLSVVVKVQATNDGDLDVTMEGPTQHPAAALFYMFDEAKRTGNWNPTTCPHCANIQKQLRTGMFGQSDSEDSDNFPPARQLRGPMPNAGSVIANDAPVIRGNYNGSLFVRRLFLR